MTGMSHSSEESRQRPDRENSALAEIGRVIGSSLNIEEVYESFAEQVRMIIPSDRITINLLDADRGLLTDAYLIGVDLSGRGGGDVYSVAGTLSEAAIRAQSAVLVQTNDRQEFVNRFPGALASFDSGLRSFLIIPLVTRSRVLGTLHLRSALSNAYGPTDVSFAERVGMQIAGAIANAQLYNERIRAEASLAESTRRLDQTVAELRLTQEQLIQQERLRALGQMASGIAHDFNNALVPILGFTELLLVRPEVLGDADRAAEYLEMIKTAAMDGAGIVARLREFYRPRGPGDEFAIISVNDLVGQAISLTRTKWKDEAEANSIVISVETTLEDVPPIRGSEVELRELLTNLIMNAVDAMPNGGTVTLGTLVEGDHVLLDVSDTGIGMTEETRRHCLEPFFTTKGDRGTGMGLAMVYGIVQRHEGGLDIYSELGRGSKFVVRLPLPVEGASIGEAERPSGPSRQLHVLVVDDEPHVRQVLEEYLTFDGHTVETATDGREALEKFTSGSGMFDVVLTDRAMPRMSGDQLAAAVRVIAPRPVIMLTGFGDVMQATSEKPVGVALILSKPVTLASLRKALAKVTAG